MSNRPLTRREVLVRGGASAGAFGLGALLAACGGDSATKGAPVSGAGATPAAGGSVVWALSADPTYVIPFGAGLTETRQATEFIYESLLMWDRNLNIKPALAESYSTPNRTTYEFKLRKGATFHDGTPVTAQDVVYSIGLQLDPPAPGTSDTVAQVPGIKKAVAVDDHTVQIVMKSPDARLPGYLAWGRYSSIVPKGLYDKIDPRTQADGTGPFKLTEFRQNDHVSYKRNPKYWNKGIPHIDQLTMRVMTDEQGRVAALRSGEIHGCTVSADIAQTLQSDPSIDVLRGPVAAHREIQFTIKPGPPKPWHDKRVRQAINHAIDRQAVIDTVFAGNADFSSIVASGYGDWPLPEDELKSNYLKLDVDQARRLMADAGLSGGFKAEMQVFTATSDTVKIAELIQQQLKAIKVDLKLQPLEVATFSKNNSTGNFDIQLTTRGMRGDVSGFVTDFDPAGDVYKKLWFPAVKGVDPRIGKLIHKGFTTLDEDKRKPIYTEIQRLVLEEALHIPICNPYKFQAVSKKLKGMYVAYTDFNTGLDMATITQ